MTSQLQRERAVLRLCCGPSVSCTVLGSLSDSEFLAAHNEPKVVILYADTQLSSFSESGLAVGWQAAPRLWLLRPLPPGALTGALLVA